MEEQMTEQEIKEVLLEEWRRLAKECATYTKILTDRKMERDGVESSIDRYLHVLEEKQNRKDNVEIALNLLMSNKIWWVREMTKLIDEGVI